jgi:hypothetical protein
MVRVDGQVYSLMGVPNLEASPILPATVRRAEFTSTHSLFDLTAGSVAFTLDFFSPVSPSNYLRQSLPFSKSMQASRVVSRPSISSTNELRKLGYLTVQVGNSWGREIQIYSDIDGRWTGRQLRSVYDFEEHDKLLFHTLSVEDAPRYAEDRDMALWGQAILASRQEGSSNLSALAGPPEAVRTSFVTNGDLSGEKSTWSAQSVVALAHDLGNIVGDASVTFAVGYERKEAINYLGDAYTGFYRSPNWNLGNWMMSSLLLLPLLPVPSMQTLWLCQLVKHMEVLT